MKNKKTSKLKIALIILGIALVISGVIFPQIMFKQNKYVFDVEEDFYAGKVVYSFEIEKRLAEIDTNSAKAIVKIDGEFEKTFELKYDKSESDLEDYVFTLTLKGNDYSIFNKVISIDAKTISGEEIKFKDVDDFENIGKRGQMIMLTVVPIFFGVFFIITAFTIGLARKNMKNSQKFVLENLVEETEQAAPVEQDVIVCKYCGVANPYQNVKCEHCGAPLLRIINKKTDE